MNLLLERAAVLEERAWQLRARSALDDVWLGRARSSYARACAQDEARWRAWCADLRTVARAGELHAQVGEEAEEALRSAFLRCAHALALSTKEQVALEPSVDVGVSQLSPTQVRDWWRGLTPRERWELEALAGTTLGPLAGLPVDVRDRVNRVSLGQDAFRRLPGGAGAQRRRRAVRQALESRGAETPLLLEYDLTAHGGDGTVVIGVGDVESAPRLAVLVTGLGSDAGQAPHRMDDLAALRASTGDVDGTAAIWWLDQDAPDGPGDPAVRSSRRAVDGGRELVHDLAGVEALRPGEGRTSLWGHSYGATTVAAAFAAASSEQRDAAGVDAVGFVGSPGAGPARNADDLGVGEVYALKDSRDVVGMLGAEGELPPGTIGSVRNHVGLGTDPTADEFGAVVLPAERDTPGWPGVREQHSSYFDPGSESLLNVGRVIRGDVVP